MSGSVTLMNPPKNALDRLVLETKLSQAFGDLSKVRPAGEGAAPAGAAAYATGNDIFFGPGGPQTEAEKLLAHELTHIVQQREARPR